MDRFKLKYLVSGIGGILFSSCIISVALYIIFSKQTNNTTVMVCFIIAGIGIILSGIGFFEFFLEHQGFLAQIIFFITWPSGVLLIIYYSIFYVFVSSPSFWLVCFIVFPVTFIMIGLHYMTEKDSMNYPVFTGIAGIIIIVLNTQFLVFLNIYHFVSNSTTALLFLSSMIVQGLTGFIIGTNFFMEFIKNLIEFARERT